MNASPPAHPDSLPPPSASTGSMGGLLKMVSEQELERVRMGRLTGAEEAEVQQALRGFPLLSRAFSSLAGADVPDAALPAPFSTRPQTPAGGQAFTFNHTTLSKASLREIPASRVYLESVRQLKAGAAVHLREAGAHWDPRVRIGPGRGAWFVEAGFPPPDGMRPLPEASIRPANRGFKLSTPASRQRYIERPSGVAHDAAGAPLMAGNIAGDVKERQAFWKAVSARERADGRVQSQIIAELPHEPSVGPSGWLRIVKALGVEFERLGLRWHGVVHKPDAHGDPRNYHLHMLYHDRGGDWEPGSGTWIFREKKAPETRLRGFIRDLRRCYAAAVNQELERAGVRRRYDPRSYRDMGIQKRPGLHLGSAAHALERQGVATVRGRWNWAGEHLWRLAKALERERTAMQRQMALAGQSAALIFGTAHSLSPRVIAAAHKCAETMEAFEEASVALGAARAVQARADWRAEDLPRRVRRMAAAAAAEGGDKALAREAESWLRRFGKGLEYARSDAFQRRQDAARRFRRAARAHLEARRILEAENLLGRRTALIAERDFAERTLKTGMTAEAILARRADAIKAENARLIKMRDGILARALNWAGRTGEAPECARARLLTAAGRANARAGGFGPAAAKDINLLDRAALRLAELKGEARRHERVRRALETAGHAPVARRALVDQALGARRAVDALDKQIGARRAWRAHAERLGVRLNGFDGMAGLADAQMRREKDRRALTAKHVRYTPIKEIREKYEI